jgi:hypothetical protein
VGAAADDDLERRVLSLLNENDRTGLELAA